MILGVDHRSIRQEEGASHNYSYGGTLDECIFSLETQIICLLTLDECIFSPLFASTSISMVNREVLNNSFPSMPVTPSFWFCLIRGCISFCTFRSNDMFVLRGEQDKCLDCIDKHVSFRSSHRFVHVISWLTHGGNISTEISSFKKTAVHIQRTCCPWFGIIYTCRNIREGWAMQYFSFGTDFLAFWLASNGSKIEVGLGWVSPPTRHYIVLTYLIGGNHTTIRTRWPDAYCDQSACVLEETEQSLGELELNIMQNYSTMDIEF